MSKEREDQFEMYLSEIDQLMLHGQERIDLLDRIMSDPLLTEDDRQILRKVERDHWYSLKFGNDDE